MNPDPNQTQDPFGDAESKEKGTIPPFPPGDGWQLDLGQSPDFPRLFPTEMSVHAFRQVNENMDRFLRAIDSYIDFQLRENQELLEKIEGLERRIDEMEANCLNQISG